VIVPPPVPGKVWPEAKVMRPLLAMDNPVSAGATVLDPNSRCKLPAGFAVSFPVGSTCQRKRCVDAADVPLLNDDARRSSGFELKPCVAVAVPWPVIVPPAAVNAPLLSAPEKVALVPVNAPASAPPASCR
jgi:hypothetical protein